MGMAWSKPRLAAADHAKTAIGFPDHFPGFERVLKSAVNMRAPVIAFGASIPGMGRGNTRALSHHSPIARPIDGAGYAAARSS